MLGEDTGVSEILEVLEDGSAVGCLVRGTKELPDVVNPDDGGIILDELLDGTLDLRCPLLDQGLGLASVDLSGGLLRDDELPFLVQAQETCRGEVVDLDAGETTGVLVGVGESSGENVSHGC